MVLGQDGLGGVKILGEVREFGAICLQLLDFFQPRERGRIAFDVVGVVFEIL
jgi:hypothetical protein